MAFPNLTELTMFGLAPDNYSMLQSTDPQRAFILHSPNRSQVLPSVSRFQAIFLQSKITVSNPVLTADHISGKKRHIHLLVILLQQGDSENTAVLYKKYIDLGKSTETHVYLCLSFSITFRHS